MAAIRTVIVDTDSLEPGFAYTNLETAQSTEQGNISLSSGSDEYVVFECYATNGTNDGIIVNINGWTTEVDNYIEVRGERLEGASWDASKWRIEVTDADPLGIGEDYVRLNAVQLSKVYSSDDTFTSCLGINNQNASNDIRISNSIIRCIPGATVKYIGIDVADADTNLTIWNTIIYDYPRRGVESAGNTLTMYNCTIEGATTVDGIFVNNGDVIIKNCAVWNNNDDIDVGGADTSTIDTCATDDGDGDNPITPVNWANVFENWTSNDYRLKSDDTDLKDKGLSAPGGGLFSDDIVGTSRPQ